MAILPNFLILNIMKQLTLILLFISAMMSAQVTIQEQPKESLIYKTANIKLMQYDDYYVFFFRNAKYQHIIDIKSLCIKGKRDLDSIYVVIKQDLLNRPSKDFERVLTLPDGRIMITYKGNRFRLWVWQEGQAFGYSYWISGSKIDSLFGKDVKYM